MLFLKKVDALVGKAATALSAFFTKRACPTEPVCASLLVIRPGGIGDAIYLIPCLRAVREAYPSAVITVLAERRNGAVFSLTDCADRVFLYDRPTDLLSLLRGRYDVVIDTEQWHRLSAVVARLTGAQLLIGFDTNDRRKLFTHPVAYAHDESEIESFFRLVAPLGIPKPASIGLPFLSLPETIRLKAAQLVSPLRGRPFVTMFPGASIPERRWGAESFRDVAERLAAKGYAVVVVGGAQDVADAMRIVSAETGITLAGRTSLAETAAVIAESALLLSGDSGILHIGVGLGKPTVSLFGPGIEKKWGPHGDRHIIINRHLPCSPCTRFGYTPKCALNSRCLAEISPQEVTAAVLALLEKHDTKGMV